ncbi:hypothetical protein PoB_006306500 [Plakobranchus ocellatus]|uniref:Uncharacterized protein n=1 Tax=Plakobranchus ocellatus TaxID=259542 RepID=A0AAV4CXP7_9GAST|nr:hypothetical protein PoB_006306500 [Plakobranchus ocellatus]
MIRQINYTRLSRVRLNVTTYHGLVWWLLFAGIPSVLFLALVLVVLCFARCCGCCCWRKKAKSRVSDKTGEREQSPEYTCPSSPGTPPRDRFHSLQTQKWVRDASNIIELDPESTYDHPQPSSAGYLIPGLRKGSQVYVQMDESPTGATGSPEVSRVINKRAATMSYGKKKGKQLKKSQTTHSLLSQTSSELSSPSNMDSHPLPKPCKLKSKDADVQKCASLPSVHNQQHQLKSPKESTLMFDFQQQLQAQIQQQQQQEQTQIDEEVVQYANTQDLIKLKGSARKMFPML